MLRIVAEGFDANPVFETNMGMAIREATWRLRRGDFTDPQQLWNYMAWARRETAIAMGVQGAYHFGFPIGDDLPGALTHTRTNTPMDGQYSPWGSRWYSTLRDGDNVEVSTFLRSKGELTTAYSIRYLDGIPNWQTRAAHDMGAIRRTIAELHSRAAQTKLPLMETIRALAEAHYWAATSGLYLRGGAAIADGVTKARFLARGIPVGNWQPGFAPDLDALSSRRVRSYLEHYAIQILTQLEERSGL